MSITSTRLALTHRTTIQRSEAEDDPWGQPGIPDWQDLETDVPCRAWILTGREQVSADRQIVVNDMRCLLPVDTDIVETDRLGDITERGEVIFEGPFGVEAVMRQRDHLEVMLVHGG